MIEITDRERIRSIRLNRPEAKNAFNETVAGIYNLEKKRQKIEIRVVLHKLTIPRLFFLSYFIFRFQVHISHRITNATIAQCPAEWVGASIFRLLPY